MKTDSRFYDLHVLICTHTRETGESCGAKGSEELLAQLKSWSKTAGLKGKVRVNKSGCLDRCKEGIACVAYPKGEWVVEAKPSDLPAIQAWVKQLNQG